jgi:hypothetical protein
MPESQAHGFAWENAIKAGSFRNTKSYPYTAVFDIPAADNPHDPTENISIKVYGSSADTLDLGDALRIFSYEAYPIITLVAVAWTQETPTTKRLVSIKELAIGGPAAHAILFGSVTRADVEGLVALLRAVPPGPGHAEQRAAVHTEKDRLNGLSGVLRFNPKMDSKSQRRLQCSLPRLSAAVAAHPALLLRSTEEPVLRGVAIPQTVESGARQRNARD